MLTEHLQLLGYIVETVMVKLISSNFCLLEAVMRDNLGEKKMPSCSDYIGLAGSTYTWKYPLIKAIKRCSSYKNILRQLYL